MLFLTIYVFGSKVWSLTACRTRDTTQKAVLAWSTGLPQTRLCKFAKLIISRPVVIIATHYFHITLHLMMMHHHTKFGYKRLSSSKHFFCTKRRHTGQKDRQTDGQIGSDCSTPPPPLNFVMAGEGGYKNGVSWTHLWCGFPRKRKRNLCHQQSDQALHTYIWCNVTSRKELSSQ